MLIKFVLLGFVIAALITSCSPKSNQEYFNPAFNGLALIIEQITGGKWQLFIEERIFEPAGMNDSKITDGPYPGEDILFIGLFNRPVDTQQLIKEGLRVLQENRWGGARNGQ